MSNKALLRIRLALSVITSALLVVTGILFIVSCVGIYKLGDRPFTVENISAAFSRINVPVYITLAVVVINAVISLVCAKNETFPKTLVHKDKLLSKLEAKLDRSKCSADALAAIEKEKKLRKMTVCIAALLCTAAAGVILAYAFNFTNFGEDYNQSVVALSLLVLPLFLVAAGICLAASIISSESTNRQISTVKSAIADGAKAQSTNSSTTNASQKSTKSFSRVLLYTRLGVMAIALVFIVLGIVNGGMADVLSKAINICTECIGLG